MEIIKLKDFLTSDVLTALWTALKSGRYDDLNTLLSQLRFPNVRSIFEDYKYENGERTISPLLENIIKVYGDENGQANAILGWIDAHYYIKWKFQYDALATKYDIVSPYDMNIAETESNQLDTDTKIDQTTTGTYSDSDKLSSHNTDNTDSIYAFNSTTNPVPTDKSVGTEDSSRSGSGSNSGTKNITTDYGSKRNITRNLTRKGNIGNTTKQELIERELRLRDTLVYKIIFKDLNEFLTRSVYTI